MGLYNWVDFNYFYLSTSILEKIYFYRKLNLLTEKFSLENVSSLFWVMDRVVMLSELKIFLLEYAFFNAEKDYLTMFCEF